MLWCILAALCSPPAPAAPVPAESHTIQWQRLGPGGGGWIESIAWDPHDPKQLYVGCDVGGFYHSSDAGRNYEIRNQGLHDYFLESLAIHPRDSRVILLGTESGVHRSDDGGRSWHWVREGFPPLAAHRFSAPIAAVAFNPQQPAVVYAGVGRPRWRKDGAGAVYRSDDTGRTWRLVSAGQLPADAVVSDLEVQPDRGQTILVATQHGLFRSDNGGAAWSASNAGLPHRDVRELAFAPGRPTVVYLTLRTTARDKTAFDGGVCRSDDAGRTWRQVDGRGLPSRVGRSDQPAQMTSQFKEIAVDPRNADVLYVGDAAWVTAGIYKSADGGRSFERVTVRTRQKTNMDYGWIRMFGPGVECLAISPADPQQVAFGTSGHVFVSPDAGRTWQQRYCRQFDDGRFAGAGLEVTCAIRIVPDPVRRDRLWFCYMDIGLLLSDDGGRSFRRSFEGMKNSGNCFDVAVDPASPDTVWAGTGWWNRNSGDVCRSADGGRTWQVVGRPETGLPDASPRQLLLDLRSPVGRRRLWVLSQAHGLFTTNDGGQSWLPANGDLPPAVIGDPRGLLLDPADSQHLLAAFAGSHEKGAGLYETRDAGRTWRRRNAEPFAPEIQSLVASDPTLQTLYVAARQHYDRQSHRLYHGGLFASRDGGQTWRPLLDFRFVSDVAVNRANPRVLYASTQDHPYHDDFPALGLLRSSDGGVTWRRENTGLSLLNVRSIATSPHDPALLYLSTSGNSCFLGREARSIQY
jgi:photosystem II stability/assembly factor-like uncharacterized protein